MQKLGKKRALMISGLAIALVFAVFSSGVINGQADPFSEIKEKMSGISEEEKENLQNLFTLTQEIESMELEEKKLAEEIKAMSREVESLEAAIARSELDYLKRKESLRQVLRSYQRMGPGSFIEIILNSDSLSAFLHRVNTLRDLTRNTGELLEQLKASGELLAKEKAGLSEKLVLLEEKQRQSKEALAKKVKLKVEMEEYLVSLKGEREHYQQYLADIGQVWNELKPLFAEAVKDFSRIIEEGSIPAAAVKISISFPDIKGAIEDRTINDIISEQSSLPPIVFAFHTDEVEISLPEKYLELSGIFVVKDGHALEFQAKEGSFYGMPLEPGSIEELFSEGDLVLDIKPLLGGNDIHALELKEGYLELIHKLGLF
ncbi:MAG TPA: hypothetical protein VEG39_14610 [Clostridia bacterium]|nr:hypothetical protein [Clostridia bacterium]